MILRKAEILVFIGKAASITEADEALLHLVHPLAESVLANYLQSKITYQQIVEYLPLGQPQIESDHSLDDIDFRGSTANLVNGRAGTEFLQLKTTPVILTGLEVREDVGANAGQASGAFSGDSILGLGTDYFLDVDDPSNELSRSGILRRVGVWPAEPRSVRVQYFGGFTSAQLAGEFGGALKLAALMTVSAAYWAAKQNATTSGVGPKMSESIGKYSYSNGQQFAASNLTFSIPMDAMNILQPYRNYGRIFG